MTKEKQFIKDAAGFMRFALANGFEHREIVATLAHDLEGLDRNARYFLPRVFGYAEVSKQQEGINKQ
jgi:hypothetical protein